MPWPTDLRLLFQALGRRQSDYDWLLTNLDYVWLDGEREGPPPLRHEEPQWLTGEELTRVVEAHELQFNWAVLSGFRPGTRLDLDALEPYPFADGNRGLWVEHPTIQHPQAEVEIVCWDSTSTLLLSRDTGLSRRFREFFPEAVDLDEHNRRGKPV